MARIFISYAREDKPVIQSLAEGLVHAAHEVWWDADLGAADAFRETIESQIAGADVVVVVWSQRANASRYVVDEAERAVGRSVLAHSMHWTSAAGVATTTVMRGGGC